MLTKKERAKMGKSSLVWLDSHYHFSFAEYFNLKNMNFGMLRVVNDDLIKPGTGFDMHPHEDMEIVTYVVNGELTHEDSMGNRNTLRRGEVQYMSAGTGVIHSEYNLGREPLRLLQIWILPDKRGCEPQYGDYRFLWQDRINVWLPIVSGEEGTAPIKIHQDMDIYVTQLDAHAEIIYPVASDRQVYMIQIEGTSSVNGKERLAFGDALEAFGENLLIEADTVSHIILFDMKKSTGE